MLLLSVWLTLLLMVYRTSGCDGSLTSCVFTYRGYALVLPPTFRNTSADLCMASTILSGKNMAVLHRSANYQGSIATRKVMLAKANLVMVFFSLQTLENCCGVISLLTLVQLMCDYVCCWDYVIVAREFVIFNAN